MQVRRSGRGPTPPPTVASGAELARAPGVREPPAGSHHAALMATRAAQRSRHSTRAIRRALSHGGEIAHAVSASAAADRPDGLDVRRGTAREDEDAGDLRR